MKAEDKFNEIKDKYIISFELYSNTKIFYIFFYKGWVNINYNVSGKTFKLRVSDLEKMIETIEFKNKKNKR